MKILAFVLYLTIGEWLEQNALGIIVAIIGWVSSAAVLIWKLSRVVQSSEETAEKVDALTQAFEEHRDDLHTHIGDTNVHSNFEYRQSVAARFAELKHDVTEGHNRIHNRIENKIDKLIDRLMK